MKKHCHRKLIKCFQFFQHFIVSFTFKTKSRAKWSFLWLKKSHCNVMCIASAYSRLLNKRTLWNNSWMNCQKERMTLLSKISENKMILPLWKEILLNCHCIASTSFRVPNKCTLRRSPRKIEKRQPSQIKKTK